MMATDKPVKIILTLTVSPLLNQESFALFYDRVNVIASEFFIKVNLGEATNDK